MLKSLDYHLFRLKNYLPYLWNDLMYTLRTKPVRSYLLATAAAGSVLQMVPQATSNTLDEHMAAQGLSAIEPYFSTAHIRVYHRHNPLQIPHMTAFAARTKAPQMLEESIFYAPLVPLAIVWTHIQQGIGFVIADDADAYALPMRKAFAERACFIRPPARAEITDFINSFSGFEAESYTFKSGEKAIADIFYTAVMAHEARHCDQGGRADSVLLNETDADIYALRVAQDLYGDTEAMRETAEIIKHLRVIGAINHSDSGHASARGLQRASHSLLNAHEDIAVYVRLRKDMDAIMDANETLLDDHEDTSRLYLSAHALLGDKNYKDPDLRAAAAAYIGAVNYLGAHTSEKLVKPLAAGKSLSTAALTKAYAPAPDRIPARAAPRKPAPAA